MSQNRQNGRSPGEADGVRQLSLDGDFTSGEDESAPHAAAPSAVKREDPRTLKSAYGIQLPLPCGPAVVRVDADRRVVEHTLGWMTGCVEQKPVKVMEQSYDSSALYDAAKRELQTTSPLAEHANDMLEVAVTAGLESGKHVRDMARELNRSASQISRISGRIKVRLDHPELAAQVKDSHLEAVIGFDSGEQRQLLELTVAEGLSVHQLEQVARERRIAFRKAIGADQRYVDVLERTGLARLAPEWADQRQAWVAWFKHALREANADTLPRGNKRHGRAA